MPALQILKNDDEVENWSLSSFLLAVVEGIKYGFNDLLDIRVGIRK